MREVRIKYFLRGIATTVYTLAAIELLGKEDMSVWDLSLTGFLILNAAINVIAVLADEDETRR